MTDELSQQEAIEELESHSGSTILKEEYARRIANAFGVSLSECPGELEPISDLDRLQPNNDSLGIGVGSLILTIVDSLGMDAEKSVAVGHGRTQRNYKNDNIEKLKRHAEN